ncbi:MAG: hypothetical protein ACLFWL_19240, partial [Candidatus Brocadiia bacterium]
DCGGATALPSVVQSFRCSLSCSASRRLRGVLAAEWDLSGEEAREELETLLGSDSEATVYVEGLEPGRAGEITLSYDGTDPALEDRVQVTVVGVEITRAPDYLFANARYATPVRFEIGAGSDTVTFEEIEPLIQNGSVKVRFYAADGDGSQEEHLRFTTNNLAPTTDDPTGRICRVYPDAEKELKILGDGDSGQKNCYEVYVPSSRFRAIGEIAKDGDDKHTTKWAHFEMTVGLNQTVLLESESDPAPNPPDPRDDQEEGHWKDEGPRVRLFGDKVIAAWDMRGSGFSGEQFKTTIGGTYFVPGQHQKESKSSDDTMCTELAHWEPFKGWWRAGLDADDRLCGFLYWWDGQSGVRDATLQRKFRVPDPEGEHGYPLHLVTGTFGTPYWNAKASKTSGEFDAFPATRQRKVYYEDTELKMGWVSNKRYWSFKHCDFESKKIRTNGKNTFRSSTYMEQRGFDDYRGEYVSKNFGMRFGGYAVASYGGKIPPCLRDSDPVARPWDNPRPRKVPERAMDLTKEDARVNMMIANGKYKPTTDTNKDEVGSVMPWVDVGFALANAAIAFSGQEYLLLLSGPAQAGVHAAVAASADKNEGGHNATCLAKIQAFYMAHDVTGDPHEDHTGEVDGRRKAKTVGNLQDSKSNGGKKEPTNMTIELSEDIGVGEQLTVWMDITSQSQLIAQDTKKWGKGTHRCSATAEYLKEVLGAEEVQVNVYERGSNQ